MYKISLLLLLNIFSTLMMAQSAKHTSVVATKINTSTPHTNGLHVQVETEKGDDKVWPSFAHVAEMKQYWKQWRKANASKNTKTRGNTPIKGKNFLANKLEYLSPCDNSIAISNDGFILSAENYTLTYADTNGVIQDTLVWNDFINGDTFLNGTYKYDPRVIYDPVANRFIALILFEPLNATKNGIIIGFTKTANPADGWNVYHLNGNPNNDTSWSDYPNVAINKEELYITLNSFKTFSPYDYNGSYIYQISTADGYAGNTNLSNKVWSGIAANDNYPGITLIPAQEGFGNLPDSGMHFVQTRLDTGSQVYHYYLNGKVNNPNAALTSTTIPMPTYYVCTDGDIRNPVNNNIDSISTGAAWVQNSFILDSIIHFTFAANIDTGWCGINYARLDLRTNLVKLKQFGQKGTSLAYPAVTSFGHKPKDKSAAIVYVQADINTLPQVCAVAVDDAMNFSAPIVIKTGDTMLSISNSPGPERWGDYSGIQRKYNDTVPTAWLAAGFSGNNPGRKAGFNTWVAQLISKDTFVNTIPIGIQQNYLQHFNSTVYPNPVIDRFEVAFQNPLLQTIKVTLSNMNGQTNYVLHNGILSKGKTLLSFNKNALAPGIYLIDIFASGLKVETKKLVIQ
jgi:hypothetical protein